MKITFVCKQVTADEKLKALIEKKIGKLEKFFRDDAEAFVFFTADQPWLREKTMEGFICEMEKQHADLGSVCQGETPGNPVWFSRKYLPDLRALSGDQGGRKILKKHPE